MKKKEVLDLVDSIDEKEQNEELENEMLDEEEAEAQKGAIDINAKVAELIKLANANGKTLDYDILMNKMDPNLDVEQIEIIYTKLAEAGIKISEDIIIEERSLTEIQLCD